MPPPLATNGGRCSRGNGHSTGASGAGSTWCAGVSPSGPSFLEVDFAARPRYSARLPGEPCFVDQPYYVHESAYVDEPCEIGEGTKIWHFCHVMAKCKIGR